MSKTLCISFRDDELNRITELMEQHSLSRHGVVKLAVRRFLFPHEKTVSLDDKKLIYATKKDKNTKKTDDFPFFSSDKPDHNPNKTSTNPPFLWKEEDPFP